MSPLSEAIERLEAKYLEVLEPRDVNRCDKAVEHYVGADTMRNSMLSLE